MRRRVLQRNAYTTARVLNPRPPRIIATTALPSEPEPPPERGSVETLIAVAERRGVTVAAETCENGVRVGVMVGVCVGVLVSVGVSEGVGVADGAGCVAVGVSLATSAVEVGLGVTGVGV